MKPKIEREIDKQGDISIKSDSLWKLRKVQDNLLLLERELAYDKDKTTFDITGPQ
jgi:hypothetical protein